MYCLLRISMAPLSLTGSWQDRPETPDVWFIEVGAGENWHELIRWMLANSIYGMENLALILAVPVLHRFRISGHTVPNLKTYVTMWMSPLCQTGRQHA